MEMASLGPTHSNEVINCTDSHRHEQQTIVAENENQVSQEVVLSRFSVRHKQ